METGIKSLDGIKEASIDFVSKRLTVETDGRAGFDELLGKIEAIVKRIEPHVKVNLVESVRSAEAKEKGDEFSRKSEIAKLAVGGLLFGAAVLLDLGSWLELTLFLASYAIVGGEVILRAVKGILSGQVFSEHFLMSVATIGAFFVGAYAEGVAVMIFYLVGELFQDMAVDHSRKSISSLMDLRSDY
jgi:Cd2+/Zn2+-exporting ATPase